MQLSLDQRAVHHERSVAGKKMGLFFSHSKKGPVFEHYKKCGNVTKFVVMPLRALVCYSETDLLTFINIGIKTPHYMLVLCNIVLDEKASDRLSRRAAISDSQQPLVPTCPTTKIAKILPYVIVEFYSSFANIFYYFVVYSSFVLSCGVDSSSPFFM